MVVPPILPEHSCLQLMTQLRQGHNYLIHSVTYHIININKGLDLAKVACCFTSRGSSCSVEESSQVLRSN